MQTKEFRIGISCIGSGVGQSVINSIRLSGLPLKTIGLGTNPFAYGAYDCDTWDYTKSIYDVGFIDNLIEKCLEHKIDLVIPGLDDETFIYAQNEQKFKEAGIKAIYAGKDLIAICRDKERMSLELNEIADVFVKSYDKETLAEDIGKGLVKFPFIAKPRGGFASRGVEIIRTIDDLSKITADHIIQELAVPVKDDPNYGFYMAQIAKNHNPQVSEISIQLVYSPEGELLGRMSSCNKLNNGVPIEIVPYENDEVWRIIDKLTPALLKMGLRGPLNIQGRITEQGLRLFEMNPRFTGITGLRALMGFNEVEACIKEWLGIDKGKNHLRFNYNRFGTRQTADKSIPIERNQEIAELSRNLNHGEIKSKKTVLITGACGYLGQNLINQLINDNSVDIWAFDLDKQKTDCLFSGKVHSIFDPYDLRNGMLPLGNVDILLHLGFTRPYGTNRQIADSLKFTADLFSRAAAHHIPAIINISSQSVYGETTSVIIDENSEVAPKTPYAQAKYATEVLLESFSGFNNVLKFTSLRLGTLVGGQPGLVEVDVLSKFTRQVMNGQDIVISSNVQNIQRLDIRDAIRAIILVLKTDPASWAKVYNLGNNKAYNLADLAKLVKQIGLANNYNSDEITVNENITESIEKSFTQQFNADRFIQDFNWEPVYSMEDSIASIFNYFMHYKLQ
jgi:nucleoside-diphosphate-sugar epimerase